MSWCAGLRWRLAAASGLPRWLSFFARDLAAHQALPERVVRRGGLLLGCLVRPSRRATPAGALVLWLSRPGKLLLPEPCLLGPASSSCRFLVFLARQAPLAVGLVFSS